MTQQIPCSNSKFNKAISPEQLNEIVEAILDGKYSWACVLLLRFAGHNPLHYIPYRTYNRLLKENCQVARPTSGGQTNKTNQGNTTERTLSNGKVSKQHLSIVSDLAYLEEVSEEHSSVHGGRLNQLLNPSLQNVKWLPKFPTLFGDN